jgi:hypothetical protein
MAEEKTTVEVPVIDLEKVETKTEAKTLTIEDLVKENERLKANESGLDKKVTELMKEKKARLELEEIKRKEAMTAQEKKDYEMAEKLKQIDDIQKKLANSELEKFAYEKLKENGLDISYSDFVMSGTNAEIELKVKKLKSNLEKEVIKTNKEKLGNNSFSVSGKTGIEGDLDKETLLRNRIEASLKNGDNENAIALQFQLKNIQKEKQKTNT